MLLTLQQVSKSFLDEPVLKNIDLAVREDDRIGLLGVNGVGKSTLLQIASGIYGKTKRGIPKTRWKRRSALRCKTCLTRGRGFPNFPNAWRMPTRKAAATVRSPRNMTAALPNTRRSTGIQQTFALKRY